MHEDELPEEQSEELPDISLSMSTDPSLTMSRRVRRTPFTSRVLAHGALSFTVYNRMLLPTAFHGLEADYAHLCRAVQVWDVGVERQVSIQGPDATRLVQWMTPRVIGNVANDRCVYLPLADETGRLLNDPVGLRLADDHWWLSLSDSDALLWAKGLARGAELDVQVSEPDVWPLAVQGPSAEELMARVFGDDVKGIRFFRHRKLPYRDHVFTVARSGWSKQGGFEIYVDHPALGVRLYDELFERGKDLDVGPGSPNLIERLEGGLLSFGNDMDMRHSPLEAGLGAFCSLDADIDALSLTALRDERERGPARRLRGLLLAAEEGPRPFAVGTGDSRGLADEVSAASSFLAEAAEAGDSFIGSQVWSPRYRCQLATAMLDEPLASRDTLRTRLDDATIVTAQVCDLPFDFNALGLKAHEIVTRST